jgi:hypothetical protein
LLEEPTAEVSGEVVGLLFEGGEGGERFVGVLGEESVEEAGGVFEPLAADILAWIKRTGRGVAHDRLWQQGSVDP